DLAEPLDDAILDAFHTMDRLRESFGARDLFRGIDGAVQHHGALADRDGDLLRVRAEVAGERRLDARRDDLVDPRLGRSHDEAIDDLADPGGIGSDLLGGLARGEPRHHAVERHDPRGHARGDAGADDARIDRRGQVDRLGDLRVVDRTSGGLPPQGLLAARGHRQRPAIDGAYALEPRDAFGDPGLARAAHAPGEADVSVDHGHAEVAEIDET